MNASEIKMPITACRTNYMGGRRFIYLSIFCRKTNVYANGFSVGYGREAGWL